MFKKLAKNALFVQSASNLSGVVHSFSTDISELRRLLPNAGTEEINKHPISVLYSAQILHLTGGGIYGGDYESAYRWAEEMSLE